MTRSFSSVAKWVLCIVLIALLVATFACCLLFSPGASVASAMSVDISDDGIVSDNNLLPFSWYSDITTTNGWNRSLGSSSSDYGSIGFTGSNSNYFCLFYNMQLEPGTYTLSLSSSPDSSSDFDSGTYDYRLAYRINSQSAEMTNLVNRSSSSIGVFDVTSITFTVDSLSTVTVGLFNCNDGLFSTYLIDIKFFKLESGSSFTGYVHTDTPPYDDIYNDGYEAGYDEGYNQGQTDGYDQGYEQGTADGVISANDIFLCTAFDIEYDPTKKNIYINKGDVYTSYTNFVVNTIAMKFVPFSCLYYDSEDGGFYPKDIVRTSSGELPDVNTSSYFVTFESLVECGQWLLDNPNDFLCSYAITSEPEPAALVFSDLTKLPNFMSGAGESYEVGYNDGYNTGQLDGNKTGYNQGYNAGYNEGVVSGADYSFLSLIGAVVDAPIKSFQGLLDFEILGVNMSSFVMAMFSLCFIFLLLKLVLR